jgi:phosphoribosylanthranilate isomerase
MTRVKICGITNVDDALAAVRYGADALGFVFYPKSPRHITPEEARKIVAELPPFVTTVGVFVDESPGDVERLLDFVGLDCAQIHGEETPEDCRIGRKVIKAIRVREGRDVERIKDYLQVASAFLLDAYLPEAPGGTGRKFNWEHAARAKEFGRPVILAGGLTPENVEEAIKQVEPYAVDVSSSVEAEKGRKDHAKLRLFIERAKAALPGEGNSGRREKRKIP